MNRLTHIDADGAARMVDVSAKPVQLRELTALFGGYDTARFVHFFTMAAIAVFLAIHVVMAIIVPKSLWAIIRGR